jgi:hypothetical protein
MLLSTFFLFESGYILDLLLILLVLSLQLILLLLLVIIIKEHRIDLIVDLVLKNHD